MRVRLAGVVAHPDDDTYALGGMLASHADAVDPTIVVLTSGGNGPIWEPAATRATLGEVREAEERAALARSTLPASSSSATGNGISRTRPWTR